MSGGKKKNKKKRVQYIDDGSTIADMSALSGGRRLPSPVFTGRGAHFKTYLNACRKMFIPMLVTMGFITLAFLILYILTGLAA